MYARSEQPREWEVSGVPTGLVGTALFSIEDGEGGVVLAPTTAGINESPAGSGSYTVRFTAPAAEIGDQFKLVFDDTAGGISVSQLEITSTGLPTPDVGWRPTLAAIGALLRARTIGDTEDASGVELGTFDTTTRPTGAQVELLIDGACADVEAVFASGTVPTGSQTQARRVAELRAALMVELSFFPEQAAENSPYLQLRAAADEAMRRLVATSQVRDLFGEDPPA